MSRKAGGASGAAARMNSAAAVAAEASMSRTLSGISLSSSTGGQDSDDGSTLSGSKTPLSRAAEREAKAAARQAKRDAKKGGDAGTPNPLAAPSADGKSAASAAADELNAAARRATDTTLELNYGNRYSLIGRNGCGKSTLLRAIAAREIPIPPHIDVYLLSEEAQPSELTALEYVIDSAKREAARLEALGEEVLAELGPDSELLMDIYDRQGELDPATFESRASTILIGLGFNATTLHKRTRDMSGGWRMRVALARALFIAPTLLLLDEPTNHLDIEACLWLEDYLSRYNKILVVVSHSQDFLNGVTTHTMVMQNRKLRTWGGNYDTYLKTRAEQDSAQLKEYKKQQEFIEHTKAFIASCGTYANLVRQGKSRQKMLDKMVEDGLVEMPFEDPKFHFSFPETVKMPPPLISFTNVAFSYSGKKEDYLFENVSFGIDSDSRIALVGPNGAGKSTLLKLMVGENQSCEGTVARRSGVTIGRYHQHSAEVLDPELSPCEYIAKKFEEKQGVRKLEDWRSIVGSFGIPSEFHLQPIKVLSEGLKTRLVFCEIAMSKPHILVLDEPTNASDMEMIDSMADAIKRFQGGVVVISHDFRLLSQVAQEVWVIDRGIHIWNQGDIRSYKAHLQKQMAKK